MLHAVLPTDTKDIKRITWSRLNHPSLSKRSAVCTTHDLGKEHSILQCISLTLDVYQICHGVTHGIKMAALLRQGSSVKHNGHWDLNKCETLSNVSLIRQRHCSLSARQCALCTGASCIQHSPTAAMQHSQLPFS